MMIALPGSEGMFSQLQDALVKHRGGRIRMTKARRDELDDWTWLANDMASRPTSIAEVVAKRPTTAGAEDASGDGMGGVVFNLRHSSRPLCWRARFPSEIVDSLVSWTRPDGTLTNSDLELAAAVAVSMSNRYLTSACA